MSNPNHNFPLQPSTPLFKEYIYEQPFIGAIDVTLYLKTMVFWAPLFCRILIKKVQTKMLRFDASLVSRITAILDSQRDQYRRWY